MTDTLLADALKAWRFLYRRGFIEGFGHLSVRIPNTDRFLLTRHSLAMDAAPDDFLTLDMSGRKLDGAGDPPGEYPIHLEILRQRLDVATVIHYHGMYSTAFTTSEQTLRPIHLMGTIFHEGVPVYPDPRLVSTRERGVALAKVLASKRAVLLRAHGAAITGASLREAVAGAFLFEENAHRASISAGLGRPLWIEDETARAAGMELLANGGAIRRVWSIVESEDRRLDQ